MPDWRLKGQYLKNCNCVANCPCDTWGYPAPHDYCEGMVAMNVVEGNFDGVDMAGVKWAGTVHWPGALHEGNGTMVAYIDEGTSEEQRQALGQIFSGEVGGPFFEVIASVVTTVHGPHFVPIEFEFDKETRRAHVKVGDQAETRTEPLKIPATEDEQRVRVQMPNGFEYKEAEVASCAMLSSDGEIKLDWKDTHSSLADVEHTNEALVA
jgi:hypothetical protein